MIKIYCDEGSSPVGVLSLLEAVPKQLGIAAQTITAKEIISGGLTSAVALIMPGGRDLPYAAKLNGEGNRQIRHFVEQGGCYVGICAGAYYGCAALDFQGRDYTVCGQRELALFNGTAQGCLPDLTDGHYYAEDLASKAIVPLYFEQGGVNDFYYHGGCAFLANEGSRFTPIARYADQRLAVVSGEFGRGYYLLSGVHFELQAAAYRETVVNQCERQTDQAREEVICSHFDQNYGSELWQAIQKGLRVRKVNRVSGQ